MEHKNGKKIEIKDAMTRKISRKYNQIMFQDKEIKASQAESGDVSISMENMQKAQDYLVEQMTNLSKEEIDELSQEKFQEIIEKIQADKNPSQ